MALKDWKKPKNQCKKVKEDLRELKSQLSSEMHSFLMSPNEYTGKKIGKIKEKIIKLNKKSKKC